MKHSVRPFLALRFFAGSALAVAAMPAAAQSLSPASAGYSKAEAILGGAPTSLAAILSAQAGGAPLVVSAFAASLPAAMPALRPAPFGVEAREPLDFSASPDRPDVFNSVAMPISRSPLDHRWNRVGASEVGGEAALYSASLRRHAERVRIEAVNIYVNGRVAFVDDSRQFGVTDRWSPAAETLALGRGDCEDYALAKMAMLRRAGFADDDLYLVVLKDLVRRADHAVLVVRSEGRFLVLDNSSDRLLDSAEIRDYRPILTFAAGKRYTHGYRRDAVAAPIVMATAQQPMRTSYYPIETASGLPSSPFASR
ncbi:MAG: transglutaminase-like cysteine peptidase [Pseudomonadota bacterium]|nr:transglutaminase-like cysteine peptidase [Pseudomonadota bacterium]